jgi:hypothetical protein
LTVDRTDVQSFSPKNTAFTGCTKLRAQISPWHGIAACVTRGGFVRLARTGGVDSKSEQPEHVRRLRNDAVSNCVKHEFCGIVHVQLLQNVCSMRFDGSRTHAQHVGNVLVAVAFGNELKDFTFTL